MFKRFTFLLLIQISLFQGVPGDLLGSSSSSSATFVELVAEQESGSFAERIEGLLDGEEKRSFLLEVDGSLVITITSQWNGAYWVEFADGEDGEVGIYSVFMPLGQEEAYLGYLASLHAIPGHSGNELLQAMELFANALHPKAVYLIDAAEVTDQKIVDGAKHRIFLRLYRIMATDDPYGWYESKGYRPAPPEELAEWDRLLSAAGFPHELGEEDYEDPFLTEGYFIAKEWIRSVRMDELLAGVPFLERLDAPYTNELISTLYELSSYGQTLQQALVNAKKSDPSLFHRANRELILFEGPLFVDLCREILARSIEEEYLREFAARGVLRALEYYGAEEIELEELLLSLLRGEEVEWSEEQVLTEPVDYDAFVELLELDLNDPLDLGIYRDWKASDPLYGPVTVADLRKIVEFLRSSSFAITSQQMVPFGECFDKADRATQEWMVEEALANSNKFFTEYSQSVATFLTSYHSEELSDVEGLMKLQTAKFLLLMQYYFVHDFS